MKDYYIIISKQEQLNFAEHSKTNLIPIIYKGITNGYLRLIKSLNSNTIAELRLVVDGKDEVYSIYNNGWGIGMLFNQPEGITFVLEEDYIKLVIPENIYNILKGVVNEDING